MSAFHRPHVDDHAQSDVIALSEDRIDVELERSDRDRERGDARPYRPRVCRCGHGEGSHRSNGSWMWLSFGVCLVDGCGCREFTAPAQPGEEQSR